MIKFNLRSIVKHYKIYHKTPLTNTELSRKIGIPERSLSYLISKHPEGIKFNTLAKLEKFFKIPVSHFFNNITDKITVSISDAVPNFYKAYYKINDKNSELKKELSKSEISSSTIIDVKVNKARKRMYYIAIPWLSDIHNYSKNISGGNFNRHVFNIEILPLSNNLSLSNQLLYKFENNLSIRFLKYINTRIIANSGLLTFNMLHDNSEIIPSVFSDSNISMSKSSSARPLNRKYLSDSIRPQNSKGALLLDYTKSCHRD